MSIRVLLVSLLSLSCTVLAAQETGIGGRTREVSGAKRLFIAADSLLYRYQHRDTYDPFYIERNLNRWAFCTRSNLSNNVLYTSGREGDDKFYSLLKTNEKFTQSFTVGYRSLYLSVGISPGIFYGRDNDDIEFSLASNGNRLGGEIMYQSADEYKGKAMLGDQTFSIPASATNTKTVDGNAYYVLNYRKFSISAATNQGYTQKKSAGSLIFSAAMKVGSSHISGIQEIGSPDIDLSYASFALGAGYGYNLVFRNMLMVHGSLRASLIVYNGGGVMSGEEKAKIPMSFPDFIINGNFAIVYPFRNYFTGLAVTLRDDTCGNTDDMFIDNFRYKANVFFGVRFGQ